jgi:hypothetical protein
MGEAYLDVVRQLADWVSVSGDVLRPVVEAYAEFVELNGVEQRRTNSEYLLETLLLGVLWRARGADALDSRPLGNGLVTELVRERRSGNDSHLEGSVHPVPALSAKNRRGRIDPTLLEITQLLDWLAATAEYEAEHQRLQGWKAFLSTTSAATNREILRLVLAFAVRFEATSQRLLGPYTQAVDGFLERQLGGDAGEHVARRSRRRVEYHLNMVGAELLNRAWRDGFLARRHHVVMMPLCTRLRDESACAAKHDASSLSCSHCAIGCAVSTVTRLTDSSGAETVCVTHGASSLQYLESLALMAGDVGIVEIACAPDLLASGWRARAKGFMAQCVLLNESSCDSWQTTPTSSSCDLKELARVLDRTELEEASCVTHRVA